MPTNPGPYDTVGRIEQLTTEPPLFPNGTFSATGETPHAVANRLARENKVLRRHLRQVLGAIDTPRGWAKSLVQVRDDLRVKDARAYLDGASDSAAPDAGANSGGSQ
jgi:hypothetical protein